LSQREKIREHPERKEDTMILFGVRDIGLLMNMIADEVGRKLRGAVLAELRDSGSEMWVHIVERFLTEIINVEGIQLSDCIRKGGANPWFDQLGNLVGNPMNMGVPETASYLHVSVNTIYKWTSQGKIPHRKIGTKKLSFCKDELDRFVASRRVSGDEETTRLSSSFVRRERSS
jgi:excisionase family DNA binding protein